MEDGYKRLGLKSLAATPIPETVLQKTVIVKKSSGLVVLDIAMLHVLTSFMQRKKAIS